MKHENKIFLATLVTGAVMLVALTAFSPIPAVGAELDGNWYEGYAENLGLDEDFLERTNIKDAEFYAPDELTEQTIAERTGTIVEKIIGVCIDEDGNGEILNTCTRYDYITYRAYPEIEVGDIVLTYCVYEGEDVVWREDYVLDTDQIIEE